MGFPIGVALIVLGYTLVYTGQYNLRYGGGLSVIDAITGNYSNSLSQAPSDFVTPNQTGATPQTGTGTGAVIPGTQVSA